MNATQPANGLGNLIIGYDEAPTFLLANQGTGQGGYDGPNELLPNERQGSHNLIVGRAHRFLPYAFGSIIAGEGKTINTGEAFVAGGGNLITGFNASILMTSSLRLKDTKT